MAQAFTCVALPFLPFITSLFPSVQTNSTPVGIKFSKTSSVFHVILGDPDLLTRGSKSFWITISLFLASEMVDCIHESQANDCPATPLALFPEYVVWLGSEFSKSSSADSFLLNSLFLSLSQLIFYCKHHGETRPDFNTLFGNFFS